MKVSSLTSENDSMVDSAASRAMRLGSEVGDAIATIHELPGDKGSSRRSMVSQQKDGRTKTVSSLLLRQLEAVS